jgi:branched-subunit amino acid aminotransferase/4-amino-4-deoxychorismate lyase
MFELPGGTGEAKIGANYAIGLKAQVKAHEKGYEQSAMVGWY